MDIGIELSQFPGLHNSYHPNQPLEAEKQVRPLFAIALPPKCAPLASACTAGRVVGNFTPSHPSIKYTLNSFGMATNHLDVFEFTVGKQHAIKDGLTPC
jgi:hypothetical protein